MVTCWDTVAPRYVAVSVVVPALTPVTTPAADTVAIALFAVCQVTSVVTFSAAPLVARTAVAEYCDVLPAPGGAPLIVNDVSVDEGNVGAPVHAV